MRRIRQRIEALRATAHDVTNTEKHGDIEIVDNVEENRVQIFFPGKPDRDTRQQLKSYGFRWSPTAERGSAIGVTAPSIGRVSAAVWSNAMTASWPLGIDSMPRGFFCALELLRLSSIRGQRG